MIHCNRPFRDGSRRWEAPRDEMPSVADTASSWDDMTSSADATLQCLVDRTTSQADEQSNDIVTGGVHDQQLTLSASSRKVHDSKCVRVDRDCSGHSRQVALVAVTWVLATFTAANIKKFHISCYTRYILWQTVHNLVTMYSYRIFFVVIHVFEPSGCYLQKLCIAADMVKAVKIC